MEDNNFFGFVSKIGSFISNNKPKENKKPKPTEKKYNIKISTDVEEDNEFDNIDNPDDEEEEEEDEEETKETEEEKKKREVKEKTEKEEKNKIQNIVLDIMKNNDNKEKEEIENDDNDEEKLDEDDENNINNIKNNNPENQNKNNINNSDNNNYPKIFNNSFPIINDDGINGAFVYDETSSCHIMLKKGNDININDYTTFPIIFLEKQKNLFYKIGMTNSTSYQQKKYIFFFDEHYLYFAKDEIITAEMDENTRRISKIVSLFDIKDFTNDHNEEQFIIKLTIKKEMKEEKIISFYIEQKYYAGFIKNFNLKLSIYGIDFFHGNNEEY